MANLDKILAKRILAEKEEELARANIHFAFLRSFKIDRREITELEANIRFLEEYVKFLKKLANA